MPRAQDQIPKRLSALGVGERGIPGEIYYKKIGKVVLNYTDIWYVAILDRSGIGMYNVFSFDESEAKLFIDHRNAKSVI